jgi:hypothetical protein
MDHNDSCQFLGDRRKHCELVISLHATYLEDKKNKDEWRNNVNEKLSEIISFLEEIKGPYHAGLWAFRIAIGVFISSIAGFIVYLIKSHWK